MEAYVEASEQYRQYKGILPFSLASPISRQQLRRLWDDAMWTSRGDDGTILAERWDELDGLDVHVSYQSNDQRIAVLAFGIREKSGVH